MPRRPQAGVTGAADTAKVRLHAARSYLGELLDDLLDGRAAALVDDHNLVGAGIAERERLEQ